MNISDNYKKALRFIIFFGMVSLFADMTYESARSITGPYLEMLGASAAIVGLVIGFGELISYGLRFFSGWVANRTGYYWSFIFVGYGVNLLAVPFIGLANSWQLAVALIITERLGKAIRTPARDAVLSEATSVTGHGKGFGLHEALDQIGAIVGPLMISGVFFWGGHYALAFGILAIPALFSIVALITVRTNYPKPGQFKQESKPKQSISHKRYFIYYLIGIAFVALGFADFPLLAYHFKEIDLLSDKTIPLIYALAMGVDAIAGLGMGTLYDRWKQPMLVVGVIITACYAPLSFLGGKTLAIIGVAIWGIGMGMIESVLRASVAHLIPSGKRSWAYGLYNGIFGFAWFLGSTTAGFLYEINIQIMVVFLIVTQLLSLPFLWKSLDRI